MILVWKPDHLVKSRPQRRNICTGRSCLVRRGGRRSDTPACFSPHQSHSLGTDVCLRGRRLGWRWSSWRWELKWVLEETCLLYYYYILLLVWSHQFSSVTSNSPEVSSVGRLGPAWEVETLPMTMTRSALETWSPLVSPEDDEVREVARLPLVGGDDCCHSVRPGVV